MRWHACFIQESGNLKQHEEQEKALKETIIRVKKHIVLKRHSAKLDPTDMQGLQKLMEAKRESAGP